MNTHRALREAFITFWREEPRNHTVIESSPLVLQNDATTLFTSSGMQPLVPFLMGEKHPDGQRLVDVQPCIRTQDIEEVGNNRHTTFFEMLGNWSLDDYFKEEQLEWKWEFLTKVLGLPTERLYVTTFEGGFGVPQDKESYDIWKKLGVAEDHIFTYDASKNWWSRSGPPNKMPAGEIGGPSSEVFYEFIEVAHNPTFGEVCNPNCDCGRFIEIGNSVFIQYKKNEKGELEELEQKNVDFGGGLERILAAQLNVPDIFETDIFSEIMKEIEATSGKSYQDEASQPSMRVIADHLRGAVFLIVSGVIPANKQQGYVLRRLIRRSVLKMYELKETMNFDFEAIVVRGILQTYDGLYGIDAMRDQENIVSIIKNEQGVFGKSLDKGLKIFEKTTDINEKTAFDLYQSYGFPFELTQELAAKKGITLSREIYDEASNQHKDQSRTASAGTFKGGLADTSDQVLKYHTATHLLHQALKDVFGPETRQEGSNITQERLRFDAKLDRKPTDEEIQKVEDIINGKIKEALPVYYLILDKSEAEKIGAASFFKEKYGDQVKVYFIGGSPEDYSGAYSKEFCGGPHVTNTSEIGQIKITKVKKIGNEEVRIYIE